MINVLIDGKVCNESVLFSRVIFAVWLLSSVTLQIRHRSEMDRYKETMSNLCGLTSYQWSSSVIKYSFSGTFVG